MKKVPTIFLRDPARPALVTEVPNAVAEWVHAGEGQPTIKLNGTCCLIGHSQSHPNPGVSLFARRTFKASRNDRTIDPDKISLPEYFQVAEVNDELGQLIGWEPVPGIGQFDEHQQLPAFKYHVDAWNKIAGERRPGTYELIGPKVQGGEEAWFAEAILGVPERHLLVSHQEPRLWLEDALVPRSYVGLQHYFHDFGLIEGIVWHHEDGRMAKIKARDFGGKRTQVPLPFPDISQVNRLLASIYQHNAGGRV